MRLFWITLIVVAFGVVTAVPLSLAQPTCAPTRADSEGPFYKPNAPERSSIGSGLVVHGVVRSAKSCVPIPGARIEWWQANRSGEYDEAHRAVMRSDDSGSYKLQTDFPGVYPGRPPHLHVKVFATGHRSLTTQLYPKPGQAELKFDLVLVPSSP